MTTTKFDLQDALNNAMVSLVKTNIEGYEGIEASKTNWLEFSKTFRTCLGIIRKASKRDAYFVPAYKAFRKINVMLVKHEVREGLRELEF